MRGFIVLCLSAVALAAPQGYNYNPGNAGLQQGTAFGGNFAGSSLSGPSGSAGFLQGGGQSIGAQGGFAGQGGIVHHQQQQQQQQAVVSKRFYIHSAPEDVEEDYKEKHITVGVPKRNYNVVFIKSGQRSNKKTAIKISPAPQEEKTVIYVLNKKTDASDVQAEVLEQATVTNKPEVFFIKYKTNEEAAHAQQQIQSQYDALGGSSQVTDEGVAPVSSVIGSLGGGDAHQANAAGSSAGSSAGYAQSAPAFSSGGAISSGIVSHGSSGSTSNAYLPPNF